MSYCHHWVSSVSFHILINSSEATWQIWTKLWWNGPLLVPFQNYVRWPQPPTKKSAILKIENSAKNQMKIFSLGHLGPNFGGMVLMWFPFRIMFDDFGCQPKMAVVTKNWKFSKTWIKQIFSSETAWPIWTKPWWNGPYVVPFQNSIRPTNMAAVTKNRT